MPHAIWKGAISFGLVHVPIALYPASSETGIDFDWLDKRSMDPIGYRRINKRTGKVENSAEIVMRGFAIDDPNLIAESRQVVQRTLEVSSDEEKADYGVIKEKIRNDLKRYIQKSTSRRPLIMPVILEI